MYDIMLQGLEEMKCVYGSSSWYIVDVADSVAALLCTYAIVR